MISLSKINDKVTDIQRLAKSKIGSPQHLYVCLRNCVIQMFHLGYASDLLVATGSSEVDPHNQFKAVKNKPYTQIDDKKICNTFWDADVKHMISLHVPANERFVAQDVVPLNRFIADSDSSDVVTKYRRLNYEDIIKATNRFFVSEEMLANPQTLNREKPNYKQMLKQLGHDYRISQHGFIRESLDDLYKGIQYDQTTGLIQFSNFLSYAVDSCANSTPFYIDNHHYTYCCYPIEMLLLGGHFALKNARQRHLTKTISDYTKRVKHIQVLKKSSLKYAIYKFKPNDNAHYIQGTHRVTKKDMQLICHKVARHIRSKM